MNSAAFIHKNSAKKLILILVLSQFFADATYGLFYYLNIDLFISPGELIRALIFFLGVYLLLIASHDYKLKSLIITIFSFGILSITYGFYVDGNLSSVIFDLKYLIKIIWPLVFLYVLRHIILVKKFYQKEWLLKILGIWGSLFALLLIFSSLFKLGQAGVVVEKAALVDAKNTAGIFLTICLGSILVICSDKVTLSSILPGALILTGMISLYSGATLVGLALMPISVLMLDFLRPKSEQITSFYKPVWKAYLFVIILIFVSVGCYNIYIKIPDYKINQLMAFQQGKIERRDIHLYASISYISERNFQANIFSQGRMRFQKGIYKHAQGFWYNSDQRKSAEIDWLSVYGSYGLLVALLIYGFYIFWFIKTTYKFWKSRSIYSGLIAISILMFLGHSALAGHCIMSPLASVPIVLLISLDYMSAMQNNNINNGSMSRYFKKFV